MSFVSMPRQDLLLAIDSLAQEKMIEREIGKAENRPCHCNRSLYFHHQRHHRHDALYGNYGTAFVKKPS